jgi:hypothetical protein
VDEERGEAPALKLALEAACLLGLERLLAPAARIGGEDLEGRAPQRGGPLHRQVEAAGDRNVKA